MSLSISTFIGARKSKFSIDCGHSRKKIFHRKGVLCGYLDFSDIFSDTSVNMHSKILQNAYSDSANHN